MKHFTVDGVMKGFGAPPPKRPPRPFPGVWPTRVCWDITLATYKGRKLVNKPHPNDPSISLPIWEEQFEKPRRFRYCGKPNRYRSLGMYRLLSQPRVLIKSLQIVEFDADGVFAWERLHRHRENKVVFGISPIYSAYHPQAPTGFSIAGAFSKQIFIKKIGRFPTYSFQQKIGADKVEAFYSWYEATFGKRLRRPKQKPMTVEIGGGIVQEITEL